MTKPVAFHGTVHAGSELLRSPVSGLACVHWRLRITQHIAPRMQLVHEVASPDAFEIHWARTGGDGQASLPPLRLRLEPESARIHAAPALHREGTPGALAAGRQFGLDGALRVEEVMLHQGDEINAEGFLDDAIKRLYGNFEYVAALHEHAHAGVLLARLEADGNADRIPQQFFVAAVGVQMRGHDSRFVRCLEHDRTGAIAEQHARCAICPVDHARQGFSADHERGFHRAGANEFVGNGKRVDES